MSALDKILLLLKDGKWHNLIEIAEKMALPKIKTELAVSFLTEHNFILFNQKTKKSDFNLQQKSSLKKFKSSKKRDLKSLSF